MAWRFSGWEVVVGGCSCRKGRPGGSVGGWEVVAGGCSCRKGRPGGSVGGRWWQGAVPVGRGGLEVQWVGGGGRGLFL